MVPVAVGMDFGTTSGVVAIAERSGQIQVRQFDTQVGAVEAYRSTLLFFARVLCRTRRWGIYPGLMRSCTQWRSTPTIGFCNLSKRTCRARRYRTSGIVNLRSER